LINGQGGGIHVSYNATLVVINSAIYSNSAVNGSGGGIDAGAAVGGARVTLINSTVSNNSALKGGGLSNASINPPIVMTNATFYGNIATGSGGNISGTARVLNTIIAGGSSSNCNVNLISSGHNLESGNSCGLNVTGDLTNTDPLLGALQDNGGSTWSHLPAANSPAIDAGSDVGCPATDQRGLLRLSPCDIGAVERTTKYFVYLPLALKNF
jgi:hypothetical protein